MLIWTELINTQHHLSYNDLSAVGLIHLFKSVYPWYGLTLYFWKNRRRQVCGLLWQIAICMLSRDIRLLIEGKFLGAGTQSHVLFS